MWTFSQILRALFIPGVLYGELESDVDILLNMCKFHQQINNPTTPISILKVFLG